MTNALTELYKRRFGADPEQVVPLRAHASDRHIYRLLGKDRPVIGILNANQAENRAFISFAGDMRRAGIYVPEIFAEDAAAGAYLEEDLGDVTLHDLLRLSRTERDPFPKSVEDLYAVVLRDLAHIQVDGGKAVDYSVCFQGAEFDRGGLLADMNHFRTNLLGRLMPGVDDGPLGRDFAALADHLNRVPRRHFMFRDFQSRNVMKVGDRFAYIDFQGGRRGAVHYDVASLLYQASAAVPSAARNRLVDAYLSALGDLAPSDRDGFLEFFPGFAFARMLQVLGTYGKVGLDGNNEYFKQSIPFALRNLRELRINGLGVQLPALFDVLDRLDQLNTEKFDGSRF
jgi:aminoglycoside/choline kinase family phosphotransferase